MADQLWTLPDVIRYWNEHAPDKQAFIFINKHGHQRTLTAGDVYFLSARFASRLRQCGFTSGDVIANGLPNSPERVVTDFGTIMAGCISLNCQIIEKDGGDFWNTANVSQCKGVIFPDRATSPAYRLFAEFVGENSQGVACYRDISVPKAPLLTKAFVITRSRADSENVPAEGRSSGSTSTSGSDDSTATPEALLASLTDNDHDVYLANCSPDEDAYIFTTSGSTGPCKLVPRTHRELLRMSRGYSSPVENIYFNDRQLSWLGGFPFDYFRSCTPRLLQDALDGQHAQCVKDVWTLLEREKCDGAFMAPSDVLDLVKEFEDTPPEFKLKFITTAGVTLRQNAMAALGIVTDAITNMYASTETGIIALLSVRDASEFKDCACGRPPQGVKFRVVDDNMEDLPPGREGNVLVKSENMFRHYYNFTPPEPIFTPDGWFMIRDRGMLDIDGTLTVTCRQGDVVSQGVILIYLSWPEAVLSKCPDVRQVAVIGIKDANDDDIICACVVPRKDSGFTEANLQCFYNENFMVSLANSILKPQIGLVMFYDSLPFNSTGKLDKRRLRDDATRQLRQKEVVREQH